MLWPWRAGQSSHMRPSPCTCETHVLLAVGDLLGVVKLQHIQHCLRVLLLLWLGDVGSLQQTCPLLWHSLWEQAPCQHTAGLMWFTKRKPTVTVLPQLLKLHSIVREIGRKEDRRGEEKKRRWRKEKEVVNMCLPSHCLCYKSHLGASACKCHSALGSLGDSHILCRPKYKNQKGKEPIAAIWEKPQENKTKHKILYVQVFTYLYILKKDYRRRL